MIADAGQALELGERESRDRRIIAVIGKGDADFFRQCIGREPARHQQTAVVTLDQRRIGVDVVVRCEIACDCGKEIGKLLVAEINS